VANYESSKDLFRIILINMCIVVFIFTTLMIVFSSCLNYLLASVNIINYVFPQLSSGICRM